MQQVESRQNTLIYAIKTNEKHHITAWQRGVLPEEWNCSRGIFSDRAWRDLKSAADQRNGR